LGEKPRLLFSDGKKMAEDVAYILDWGIPPKRGGGKEESSQKRRKGEKWRGDLAA